MRKIIPGEITRIKNTAQDSFMDSCTIAVYSGATDSYGDILKSWITGTEIDCGFQIVNGSKNFRGEIIVSEIAAQVRLPLGTEVTVLDRVTITKRNGVAISGISYSIDAVLSGISCLTVNLKNIEG